MNRSRTTAILAPLMGIAVFALSACTERSSAEGSVTSPARTVPVTDSIPRTTSTTARPTTTTAESTTTLAPTTTAAPTTTLAPNVVVVGPSALPIEAVGKRDGDATRAVQERLTQLGFWVGPIDGDFGFTTTQAVMAFQKYVGLPAEGVVDQATADRLATFTERAHGLSDTGNLVEVDKVKQLLHIVVDGTSVWTINTSTGSGVPYEVANKQEPWKTEKGDSITPNGLWKVDRERPDGWWEGDLGKIYRPKYFRGGVAIHGMTSVPNYPASHGCVRVSVWAMDFIWDSGLVPLGTPVWVHELNAPAPPPAPTAEAP